MSVITLIFTIHAYLASGHLRSLLCQSTAEQLFLKTSFIRAHMPYSITAHVYTLAYLKQPTWTDKSTKKGNFPMKHTTLGELTETPGHAWLRVRPNTQLLLAYKRRARGPIWKRKKNSKETLPICIFPLSQPFSHPCARRDTKQRSWRTVEGEPKIRFTEWWPVSTFVS